MKKELESLTATVDLLSARVLLLENLLPVYSDGML